MGKYIVKRLFAMALTLFIIITISFFAIRLIPGDVLGEGANPELRAAMRARYHLINRWLSSMQSFCAISYLLISVNPSRCIRAALSLKSWRKRFR